MAHAKKADGYPQSVAGSAFNAGPEAPKGNKHTLLKPSGVQVDNGVGLEGVFKKLVDDGYAVRTAQPTQKVEIEVFSKHKGQQQ